MLVPVVVAARTSSLNWKLPAPPTTTVAELRWLPSVSVMVGAPVSRVTAAPCSTAWVLVPVTDSEVNYKIEFGLEALEKRFEATQMNALDWARPAVA